MLTGAFNSQARLLLKSSLIGTFAEAMFLPIYAVFTERVGGSLVDAGIGFALFSVVSGSIVILVGTTAWFQRYCKQFLVGGFFLSAVAKLGYILVRNPYQLFVVQATIGLALGMANPAWDGLYSEDVSSENATKKWSVWTGGIEIVTGMAALAGALIAVHLGFKYLFITMAAIDCVSTYFAARLFLLPGPPARDSAATEPNSGEALSASSYRRGRFN